MTRLKALPSMLGAMAPRLGAMPKVADQFYKSPEWLALRRSRMKDPDYAAAKARAKDGERLMLDHVREIRDGGAKLDPKNTQWLTHSEHQAKTARAKVARSRGQTWGGG